MSAQWYVAKHVSDPRRREPRNVGVVLFADDRVEFRFLGLRPDGSVDGHRTKWAGDVKAYRAWVEYWQRKIGEKGLKSIKRLLTRDDIDTYYLEPSGERLVGKVGDAGVFADKLFATLVDDEAPTEDNRVIDLAERVFVRLGIRAKVSSDFPVSVKLKSGKEDLLNFDYKYQNGALHLFRVASLTDPRADLVVHAVRDSFRAIKESETLANTVQTYALIKPAPMDAASLRRLAVLEDEATKVIDVADEDGAARALEPLVAHP